jgi:hypothetical protein
MYRSHQAVDRPNVYSALDSFILAAFGTAWAIQKRAAHEINAPGFNEWPQASAVVRKRVPGFELRTSRRG